MALINNSMKAGLLFLFTVSLPFFAGFLLSAPHISLAAGTDANYQLLAPIDTIKAGDTSVGITLVDYMKGLFVAVIGFAIILAVVELVVGGIEYVAAAVPSAKEDAKKRIGGAVGGLLLILIAWILLQALNPKLLSVGLNLRKLAVVGSTDVSSGTGAEPTVTQWCGVGRLTGEWIGIQINTEKECNDVKGIMETCQLCSSLWCIDGPERGTVRYGSKEKCESNAGTNTCSLCTTTTPTATSDWSTFFNFDGGIIQQVSTASGPLSTLLSCMAGKLPSGVGTISSISDSKIISGEKTFTECLQGGQSVGCAHGVNSCHYGGTGCTGSSYAVDFGDQQNMGALSSAAEQCNSRAFINNEDNHLHVSVGSVSGCACN